MHRRTFLTTAGAAVVATPALAATRTRWRFRHSEGLDAVLLLGVLAGANMQAEQYPEERTRWLARLAPPSRAAIERLKHDIQDTRGALAGPWLALIASAGPHQALAALSGAFEHPRGLHTAFVDSAFWAGEDDWTRTAAVFPDVAIALRGLENAGFVAAWRAEHRPAIDKRCTELAAEFTPIDLVATQQHFVSRRLDPVINVYLTAFNKPHGIKIIGQQFLTSPEYPSIIVKQNAAHEIFHPFLTAGSSAKASILARMATDPLLKAVVAKTGANTGYDSIEGLVEEGSVQALEALTSQALGFGRADQLGYWREQDGGIHVFAAAMHGRTIESGFARTGGDTLVWLDGETRAGRLVGDDLRRRAATALGADAVMRWS